MVLPRKLGIYAVTSYIFDDFKRHPWEIAGGASFYPYGNRQWRLNLHVIHTEEGRRKAAEDFRRIIDRAIEHRGRFYLTYHRWATRAQVEACYPRFVDFLRSAGVPVGAVRAAW